MQKLNKARFLIYERPVNKEKGKIFSSFSLFFVECDLPLCQDESPFLCRPMTSEIVTGEMSSETSTDVTTTEDNVTNRCRLPSLDMRTVTTSSLHEKISQIVFL